MIKREMKHCTINLTSEQSILRTQGEDFGVGCVLYKVIKRCLIPGKDLDGLIQEGSTTRKIFVCRLFNIPTP